MEQIMEFLGLRYIALYLLISSCTANTENFYSYSSYRIGSDLVIDTLDVIDRNHQYEVRLNRDSKSHFFHIRETDSRLLYSTTECDDDTEITLEKGIVVDNNCPAVYPLIGERMSILGSKHFNISDSRYEVYKIFNENGNSYLNSSTIFWVKNYGVVLVLLTEGRYFELKKTDNDKYPWRSILKAVKNDSTFSNLIGIPPTPPPPPEH